MYFLEPVLATSPVAEALEPTSEVIGNWFCYNFALQCIYFFQFIYYLEPALAAPAIVEPAKPAEEVAGNRFPRIIFEKNHSIYVFITNLSSSFRSWSGGIYWRNCW